jgi:hypothetical protein
MFIFPLFDLVLRDVRVVSRGFFLLPVSFFVKQRFYFSQVFIPPQILLSCSFSLLRVTVLAERELRCRPDSRVSFPIARRSAEPSYPVSVFVFRQAEVPRSSSASPGIESLHPVDFSVLSFCSSPFCLWRAPVPSFPLGAELPSEVLLCASWLWLSSPICFFFPAREKALGSVFPRTRSSVLTCLLVIIMTPAPVFDFLAGSSVF